MWQCPSGSANADSPAEGGIGIGGAGEAIMCACACTTSCGPAVVTESDRQALCSFSSASSQPGLDPPASSAVTRTARWRRWQAMTVHLGWRRAAVVVPVLVVHAEPRVAAVVALHEGGRQGAQHACAAGEGGDSDVSCHINHLATCCGACYQQQLCTRASDQGLRTQRLSQKHVTWHTACILHKAVHLSRCPPVRGRRR